MAHELSILKHQTNESNETRALSVISREEKALHSSRCCFCCCRFSLRALGACLVCREVKPSEGLVVLQRFCECVHAVAAVVKLQVHLYQAAAAAAADGCGGRSGRKRAAAKHHHRIDEPWRYEGLAKFDPEGGCSEYDVTMHARISQGNKRLGSSPSKSEGLLCKSLKERSKDRLDGARVDLKTPFGQSEEKVQRAQKGTFRVYFILRRSQGAGNN